MYRKQVYFCLFSILVVCQESQAYYNDDFYDAEESVNGTAECGTLALNSNSSYIIKGKDGLGSCTWLFLGTNECYPMITCSKFVIKSSYYCLQDFLALSDGSTDVGLRFCGKHRPHYATSQTSILQVTLVVNSDYGSPDFKCKVSCAKHHLNYNGYGSGYNYRQPFPPTFIPTTPLKTTNCDCGKKGPPIKNNTSPAPSAAAIQTDEGVPVDPGEYRMFVGIVLQNQSFPFCGGTLVTDTCVLTSAVCCTFLGIPASAFQLLFNAVDTFNTTGSTVRKNVSTFTVHPLFNGESLDNNNNVCIMTLSDPVKLTGYYGGSQKEPIFQTTCLPPAKTYYQYLDQNVTIVGFSDPNDDFSSNEVIMKANVTILPNNNCTEYGPLQADQGCFLSNDTGICWWDSGDPLFVEVYKRYVQVGTAALTFDCADSNSPQLFTRLSEVDDWIRMVCAKSTWCNGINTYYKYDKTYYN